MAVLSRHTITSIPDAVSRPSYDREALGIGIVHIGPGAFHRGHQAVFTEDAVTRSGGDWGISAVSLNSTTAEDVARDQDGLYTLAVKDQITDYRVVGIIKEGLCARKAPDAVLARLSNPATHIVTLTITEKGYARAADGGLDMDNAAITKDIKGGGAPTTAIGYLVRAFALRRAGGAGPMTVISCDNLPDNGHGLRRACLEFAGAVDGDLVPYIERNITFPNTMVDSITPASDDALLADIERVTGLSDVWAVQRERFSQWVIEDNFAGPRPDWEAAGVTITDDVSGYEMVKLRILNGAHIALTYMGLLAGLETVQGAVEHDMLGPFVDVLMRYDSMPSLIPPKGLDTVTYWEQTQARFKNPHIRHRLEQIAHDGSQKIPARILPVIAYHQDHSAAPAAHSCIVLAAWIEFTRQRRLAGVAVIDGYLNSIRETLPDPYLDAGDYAAAFLALGTLIPENISGDAAISDRVIESCEAIAKDGILALAAQFLTIPKTQI